MILRVTISKKYKSTPCYRNFLSWKGLSRIYYASFFFEKVGSGKKIPLFSHNHSCFEISILKVSFPGEKKYDTFATTTFLTCSSRQLPNTHFPTKTGVRQCEVVEANQPVIKPKLNFEREAVAEDSSFSQLDTKATKSKYAQKVALGSFTQITV